MAFTIDTGLCARCGSCIGNCPNRAIIRRGDSIVITDMCCDCGTCIRYCTVGAVSPGHDKAVRDPERLNNSLRDKLGLKKNIAAMKFVDTIPDDIPLEQGPHFWCGMCGDIFDGESEALVFTAAASTCGGCANVGLGAKRVGREEFDDVLDGQVIGRGNLYATRDVMSKNRGRFPQFSKIYAGVIIGPFNKIKHPDSIIFPINAHQLCMISTAYAFDTGELMYGFAGKSTCLMSLPYPLEQNQPVFCAGDHGGRMFMRLDEQEILVCLPFSLVPGIVKNLDKTVFAQ